MKIPALDINSFLQKGFKSYSSILIFGGNSGLVSGRAKILQNTFFQSCLEAEVSNTIFQTKQYKELATMPIQLGEERKHAAICKNENCYNISHLEYDLVNKDPSILESEIKSMSLLGDRKFILVQNASTSINKKVHNLVDRDADNNLLVFTAKELPPSSSMRKFFEKSSRAAIIPCYYDNVRSLKSKILSKFEEKGLKIEDKSTLDYIANSIRGDQASIDSELNKILLYYEENKVVSLDDIAPFINKNSMLHENSYDDLIQSIMHGNLSVAEIEYTKLVTSGVSVIGVIRNVANYFIKLLKVKTLTSQGKSESYAMGKLRPPIFFQNQETFKVGTRKYSLSRMLKSIEILTKAEKDCKNISINHGYIWDDALLKII